MYKLVVLTALLAVTAAAPGIIGGPVYGAPGLYGGHAGLYGGHAGLIGAPGLVSPWGHGLVGAGVIGAPVVKAALPVATSYANTVRVASPAVVAAPSLVAAHGPVLSPYGHGW